MNELKPCPFCGCDARTVRVGSWWCVACRTPFCCDVGKCDTEAEAIEAWNTRYDQQLDAIPATEENMARYGWVRELTCRNESADGFLCSACSFGDFASFKFEPNYCPNCGARVTPKNSETTPKVVSE